MNSFFFGLEIPKENAAPHETKMKWNHKKIWHKCRTQGNGSAPQCVVLAPDHRAETVSEGRPWHTTKVETINLKAREHS